MQIAIAEGQVWTFKDAPSEDSRMVIRRIEAWPAGGEIVHVTLHDLPNMKGDTPHMPFDRPSIEASLDRLIAETPPDLASFEAAYDGWKAVHNDIFRVPVSHAVKMMLVMVRSRNR